MAYHYTYESSCDRVALLFMPEVAFGDGKIPVAHVLEQDVDEEIDPIWMVNKHTNQ
jgi:hypothetical protein